MKVLGFVILTICATTIYGLPTQPRSGEPHDCSKECLNGVIRYGQELSILKHSDLSNYFNKIDEVCEVIATARKCIEGCGAVSNPFALESLNYVCQPSTVEKIAVIKQCLHYVDTNINEICSKECSSDHIIDETDVTPKMNPMMKKANGDCATFKCMARCNVEVVANQCGKDLGQELQGLLQQVMDIQLKDLQNLNLVEAMEKTTPPECNYLYDPTILFGKVSGKQEDATTTPTNPQEDAKTLYAQAQLQLLLKQIELTEKQDQLVDRENAKLDMEMSYLAHKTERYHVRRSLPENPSMEKMPKESMPVEPEHGMGEAHPPMPMEDGQQADHPPMEEGHPQPESEEPNQPNEGHPEIPQSPMESQPPMPEESHQPMEGHPPMPMENMPPMIMVKIPKNSMPPPMIMSPEGIPMEFVPLGPIPMGGPMPMEAMPRFL